MRSLFLEIVYKNKKYDNDEYSTLNTSGLSDILKNQCV